MIAELKRLIRKLRKKSLNAYVSGWNTEASTGVQIAYTSFDSSYDNVKRESSEDTRVVKKPVEIVNEIVSDLPVINLGDLDKQIKIVQRRIDVLEEQGVNLTDEPEALGFLKARKKYSRYANLFKWDVTTIEKIQTLCSTYKVMKVSFSGYHKTVPNEALDELEKFALAYEKVRNDKPILELIVDQGGPEQRKDPILLARSPFGKWYYILGAWDKEVEIVDDLIYKGK